MRLYDFFRKFARDRGVVMAEKLASNMRKRVSKKAPVRRTISGRIVATMPATKGDPPRLVTGNLKNKIKVQRTARGAKVVSHAPYSSFLENRDHPFMKPSMKELGLV